MSASGQPLLELSHVDAAYGPFRAIFDVSLTIDPGQVLALLGANGGGKTTVARVASGLVAPSAGTVRFDGEDMTGRPTYEFARAGIVHAPEGRSVFASLTVEENLELALRASKRGSEVTAAIARAYELFPRLGERARQTAGTLSGGEQRMLSLARVMVEHPRLLIADELSLGLAPIIVDEVYTMLGAIRAAGTTLLIIEQHVSHALAIADDVAVMVKGAVEFHGPVGELGDINARILAASHAEPGGDPGGGEPGTAG